MIELLFLSTHTSWTWWNFQETCANELASLFTWLQTGPLAAYYKLPLNRVLVVINSQSLLTFSLFFTGSTEPFFFLQAVLCEVSFQYVVPWRQGVAMWRTSASTQWWSWQSQWVCSQTAEFYSFFFLQEQSSNNHHFCILSWGISCSIVMSIWRTNSINCSLIQYQVDIASIPFKYIGLTFTVIFTSILHYY